VDLYEHQGKDLFARFEIPVPRGIVATSGEEAAQATKELGGRSVVKVQVAIGGRGKGGGVVVVDSPERAAAEADRMLRDGFKDMAVRPCRSPASSTPRSCSTARPAGTWR
jgi:succinyl-CoA synthetase beta subunit